MSRTRLLADLLASGRLTVTTLTDGSGVVLDVESLQVLSLNPSGAFLLERLGEGVTDEDALARALTAEFEVDLPTARRDLDAFLDELAGALLPHG